MKLFDLNYFPNPTSHSHSELVSESKIKSHTKRFFGRQLPQNDRMCSKAAFTLAEVLITLGVIGIVSALTIPGLMTAYKAHQLRTQFLKSYSTVQQAFKQMEADDVSLNQSDYGSNDGIKFYEVFARYVKPAKLCFRSNLGLPCYNYSIDASGVYKNLTGKLKIANTLFDDGQIALLDGTLLLFESPNSSLTFVFVDLNGAKNQPNRLGYDLFVFQFNDGVLKTMGDKDTKYTNMNRFCDKNSNERVNGMACAQLAKSDSEYFKKLIREFK